MKFEPLVSANYSAATVCIFGFACFGFALIGSAFRCSLPHGYTFYLVLRQFMPVIFRHQGLRFFFYADEGTPREPVHLHVRGNGGEGKFWLKPMVRVEDNYGFDSRSLRELTQVIEENVEIIERSWHEHFS